MSDITLVLIIWAIVGFLLVPIFNSPKNKAAAWWQLLVSGPVGWVVFLYINIIK